MILKLLSGCLIFRQRLLKKKRKIETEISDVLNFFLQLLVLKNTKLKKVNQTYFYSRLRQYHDHHIHPRHPIRVVLYSCLCLHSFSTEADYFFKVEYVYTVAYKKNRVLKLVPYLCLIFSWGHTLYI